MTYEPFLFLFLMSSLMSHACDWYERNELLISNDDVEWNQPSTSSIQFLIQANHLLGYSVCEEVTNIIPASVQPLVSCARALTFERVYCMLTEPVAVDVYIFPMQDPNVAQLSIGTCRMH